MWATASPAEAADQTLGIFAAGRAGEFAGGDPTLVTLLGREPIELGAVLREMCPASEVWTAPNADTRSRECAEF